MGDIVTDMHLVDALNRYADADGGGVYPYVDAHPPSEAGTVLDGPFDLPLLAKILNEVISGTTPPAP